MAHPGPPGSTTERVVERRFVDQPFGFSSEQLLGMGLNSCVWHAQVVFKSPHGENEKAQVIREEMIYTHLQGTGSNTPGLLMYYGRVADCLILSLAEQGSIRQYYARHPSWAVDLRTKLRWIQEIATTFDFIHSRNVLHCDISSNNIFLDGNLRTKVADFGGSAFNEHKPLSWYEMSHALSLDMIPSPSSDRFALGSTFYEILTGKRPFYGLDDDEVESAIAAKRFPDLHNLSACRDIIHDCWHSRYSTTNDLVVDIDAEGPPTLSPTSLLSPKLTFPVQENIGNHNSVFVALQIGGGAVWSFLHSRTDHIPLRTLCFSSVIVGIILGARQVSSRISPR